MRKEQPRRGCDATTANKQERREHAPPSVRGMRRIMRWPGRKRKQECGGRIPEDTLSQDRFEKQMLLRCVRDDLGIRCVKCPDCLQRIDPGAPAEQNERAKLIRHEMYGNRIEFWIRDELAEYLEAISKRTGVYGKDYYRCPVSDFYEIEIPKTGTRFLIYPELLWAGKEAAGFRQRLVEKSVEEMTG